MDFLGRLREIDGVAVCARRVLRRERTTDLRRAAAAAAAAAAAVRRERRNHFSHGWPVDRRLLHAEKADLHASLQPKQSLWLRLAHG